MLNKKYRLLNVDRRHQVIALIKAHLDPVINELSNHKERLENRAFGKLSNTDNPSYSLWRQVYTDKGWTEIEEYKCFEDRRVSIAKDSGTVRHPYASYDLEMSYLDSYAKQMAISCP